MKLLAVITEIFNDFNVYPVRMYEDSQDGNTRTIRYAFKTKDDVQYKILLNFWPLDKQARIDFHTVSKKNPNHTEVIDLINTHDAIKVFNTLRHIIYLHKNEIKKLVLTSTADRINFYKKMINYLHLTPETKIVNGQHFLFVNL